MPKRTSSEPPLPKGLACARCKARKVKCNGGPGPCNSCLRTARFRGHDVATVTCAYHGEGRCSEDVDVEKVGEPVKGSTKPAARPSVHAKAPSMRASSGSSVFENALPGDTPPPSFYYPTPQASTSSLYLPPSFSDLYNLDSATQSSLPPLGPSTSTLAPTISARRVGGQSMKIDLSPASFLFPNPTPRSAPLATPSDWAQSLPSLVSGSPASFAHSSSSLSTSSIESHKSKDDFYTLPYPSPSIALGNSYGASPLQSVPFSRCASGGTVSLAATPFLGGLWDSPSWEARKEYWMDLS